MKRDIREVSEGRLQITTADERWYARRVNDNTAWDFVPSVTWITGHYPKGVRFYKWLATTGWDEAEEIKSMAGDKGSKVHQAIGVLLSGGTVEMDYAFENQRTLQPEPLTPQEYECLMSFCEWFEEMKPQILDCEYTVWNERFRYAGTVDIKCRVNLDNYKHIWIVDVKTSPEVWPSYELQISAYKHAEPVPEAERRKIRLAILQVGYKRNKLKKWKFTPVKDQFKLFLSVRKIWEKETAGIKPLQRDYPLSLTLTRGNDAIQDAASERAGKTLAPR